LRVPTWVVGGVGELKVQAKFPGVGTRPSSTSTPSSFAARVATAIEASTKAFRALRALGFGERETRQTLAALSKTHVGNDAEVLLRECLRELTHRACATSVTGGLREHAKILARRGRARAAPAR
jgi:hypothetical protein